MFLFIYWFVYFLYLKKYILKVWKVLILWYKKQELTAAFDQKDPDAFTAAVAEYDSLSRLDAWKTSMLVRCLCVCVSLYCVLLVTHLFHVVNFNDFFLCSCVPRDEWRGRISTRKISLRVVFTVVRIVVYSYRAVIVLFFLLHNGNQHDVLKNVPCTYYFFLWIYAVALLFSL